MKKNKIDGNYIINQWLKYHNTTIEEVFKNYPNYKDNNRQFYLDYAITQKQHDDWEIWAKDYVKKHSKLSNAILKHDWPWLYLNVAPSIKTESNE